MGIVLQRSLRRVEQRPRHPEVDNQSATRLEPNNQILATAIDLRHALAFELARDLDRVVRAGQPCIADLDLIEGPALERGRDPPADGLDLR
jgi:hypothetical protein